MIHKAPYHILSLCSVPSGPGALGPPHVCCKDALPLDFVPHVPTRHDICYESLLAFVTVTLGFMAQNVLKSMPHLLETLGVLEETLDKPLSIPETEASCTSQLMAASLGCLLPLSHPFFPFLSL